MPPRPGRAWKPRRGGFALAARLQLPTVRLPASAVENLEPGSYPAPRSAGQHACPCGGWAARCFPRAQAVRQGAHRAARIEQHGFAEDRADDDLSRLLDRGGQRSVFAGAGRGAGTGRVAAQAASRPARLALPPPSTATRRAASRSFSTPRFWRRRCWAREWIRRRAGASCCARCPTPRRRTAGQDRQEVPRGAVRGESTARARSRAPSSSSPATRLDDPGARRSARARGRDAVTVRRRLPVATGH